MLRPSALRAPLGRCGVALPLVLVMLVVLGGALYAIHLSVDGYRRQATRYRDGEVAFHAARGALRFLEGSLERLLTGRPPSPGPARDLLDHVVWMPASDLAGAELPLDLPDLSGFLPDPDQGRLVVSVRFPEVRYLPPPEAAGFPTDPYEKSGVLELEVRAEVGHATRRLGVRRPFRVLYRLPPALGRFALFLGGYEGGEEGLNRLDYSPRLGLFHDRTSGRAGWPLVVYPDPEGADPDTPPAERDPGDPLAAARRGGWVGLAGSDPWVLNLTFGAGDGSPLEEGAALRNFAAVYPSEAVPGAWEKGRRLGLSRDLLRLPWLAPGEADRVPGGTSLLHLAGDARAPAPPLVLGRAFRRYLRYSKLADREDGPFASFHGVDEDDFDRARDLFDEVAPGGAGYDAYRQLMMQVVTKPYNRTYDFLATSAERRAADGTVEAGGTPWVPPHLLSEGLAPLVEPAGSSAPAGFLYPDPGRREERRPWGPIRLATEERTPLFAGPLDALLPGVAEQVRDRAVWRIQGSPGDPPQDRFERLFLRGEALRLGTSCHLQGADLTVGPLHVESGGTLVVDRDVTVVGPVTTAPGELLAIVSLEGDVRLANEAPVVAGLVSCRGRVLPSPRGSDVRGLVAAARLDTAAWAGTTGGNRVVYDPRWNPGDPERRFAQFRVHLGRARELVVERR